MNQYLAAKNAGATGNHALEVELLRGFGFLEEPHLLMQLEQVYTKRQLQEHNKRKAREQAKAQLSKYGRR